jgi:hypothetical protein
MSIIVSLAKSRNQMFRSYGPVFKSRSVNRAILTELFRGIPHSLKSNVEIVAKLAHKRFLPYPFQFTSH